ncbi:hypothetical protein GS496_17270 [Rhodococcus hoagii]|nr:hypothetical protein [Prescottella equi]NKS42299.1 hypothetical protein [Prescottella equi]
MAKQLVVIHADGRDTFDTDAFSVNEGVLLVFTDRSLNTVVKAYNREVWAYAEFVEVT